MVPAQGGVNVIVMRPAPDGVAGTTAVVLGAERTRKAPRRTGPSWP